MFENENTLRTSCADVASRVEEIRKKKYYLSIFYDKISRVSSEDVVKKLNDEIEYLSAEEVKCSNELRELEFKLR